MNVKASRRLENGKWKHFRIVRKEIFSEQRLNLDAIHNTLDITHIAYRIWIIEECCTCASFDQIHYNILYA